MAYALSARVLTALADPTRRSMFEALVRAPRAVGELAQLARVSQPAASQHLAVLRAARLVTHEQVGTRRNYRASRAGLDELKRYLESMWDDVLAAYAADDPAPPARQAKKKVKR